jgi:putative membrane protein
MQPWVRTGLVSLAAGVGARTSLGSTLPEWALLFFTSRLVLFSAFFAVAVWRDLRPGHDSPPHSNVWRISPGVLLVAFSALLGVWFGRTGGG